MNKTTIKIENPYEVGKRLDVYLAETLDTTRSQISQLIKYGKVALNGKSPKTGNTLKLNDLLEIELASEVAQQKIIAQDLPLDIIFEDNHILVVNKPQGVSVHPGGGATTGTLANALAFYTKSLSSISGIERPGIVHRLDKDTSGLLVVAKTNEAHLNLSNQFSERLVTKKYLAILEGVLKQDTAEIKNYLARCEKDRKKIRVAKTPASREAISIYTVLERFVENSYVEFNILTGRTHQIRVHAKFIGHPVVGDRAYGYKKQKFNTPGQLLHAGELHFNHPLTGERLQFKAEPNSDFLRVLNVLRNQ